MRKASALALLIALALPFTAERAEAQGFGFVPYIGYNLDAEAFLVGVGGEFANVFDLGNLSIGVRPTVEYLFVDDGGFGDASITFLQINGDLITRFGAPGASLVPYAGAGLAIVSVSYDADCDGDPFCEAFVDEAGATDIGLNVLGGVEFPGALGFGSPFVQGRLTLADGSAISILGGLVIPLGAN